MSLWKPRCFLCNRSWNMMALQLLLLTEDFLGTRSKYFDPLLMGYVHPRKSPCRMGWKPRSPDVGSPCEWPPWTSFPCGLFLGLPPLLLGSTFDPELETRAETVVTKGGESCESASSEVPKTAGASSPRGSPSPLPTRETPRRESLF